MGSKCHPNSEKPCLQKIIFLKSEYLTIMVWICRADEPLEETWLQLPSTFVSVVIHSLQFIQPNVITSCMKTTDNNLCITYVAASCNLSLHTCNQSLFVHRLSIGSCAYAISQWARWPIRTPHPTYTNQDAWVVITIKRLEANSIHTAAWHS